MNKEKVWGPIIYTGREELEEDEDPIRRLIKRQEELKKKPVEWKEGETLNEASARRDKKIAELEKKIWDLIYIKRQKKLKSVKIGKVKT